MFCNTRYIQYEEVSCLLVWLSDCRLLLVVDFCVDMNKWTPKQLTTPGQVVKRQIYLQCSSVQEGIEAPVAVWEC